MLAPLEIRGRPAAPGLARGPRFRIGAPASMPHGARIGPDAGAEGLAAAIALSLSQVEALIAASEGAEADILEFQAAMLADDTLSDSAYAILQKGGDASAAWNEALSAEIVGYLASEDDYFRARAADIADIRDWVLRNLSGAALEAPPPGSILVGDDISPTRFLEADWSSGGGLALAGGSAASHVAILARSRGVPMVVGLGPALLQESDEIIVDGESGTVVLRPGSAEAAAFEARREAAATRAHLIRLRLHDQACSSDGVPIKVMVNIAGTDDLDRIDVATCDGVGLMRTEFLFGGGKLPDEEEQFRVYARVLEWANGRPVTIRTIDAGGDKPVKGLTVAETNPFLGIRGIRLSLARPEIFSVQLRALARAAPLGDLKVMLPMVSVPEEISAASKLLDAAVADAVFARHAAIRPSLGIMVEVPAVAIAPQLFGEAEFFSIGSNDLIQYVMAAARDNPELSHLQEGLPLAVERLIATVAAYGSENGIDVSLCGDAASDPAIVPRLLKAGLRSLSVAPAMLGAVKAAIAEVSIGHADG